MSNSIDGFNSTRLSDGLWAIDDGMVRCFLVVGNERAVLVDSCKSVGTALSELVKELTPKPVTLVFSHTDRDHTGGQEGFGVPLLHPSEYSYYLSKGNDDRTVEPLWEGDVLDLGGRSLEVVLVPGHTPGSIALLDRAERRLFVGDVISDFWIHMFGAGRNLRAFIESLKKLEGMAHRFDCLYACHGSAELGTDWIARTREAAEKLLADELEGVDPPADMPCKAYSYQGVTFLY